MSTVGKWVIRLLASVGLVAISGAIGFVAMGLSSRSEPPALEVVFARTARHLMIPAAARRAAHYDATTDRAPRRQGGTAS